jgi:hypothetical protein
MMNVTCCCGCRVLGMAVRLEVDACGANGQEQFHRPKQQDLVQQGLFKIPLGSSFEVERLRYSHLSDYWNWLQWLLLAHASSHRW